MSIGRVPGATGIQPSIVDAKGDLIVATAADSVDRLAVGTNEQRLVADSTVATGLKYVADTTNYAIAAKGDLLVGTAADTVSALTVGSANQVLTVDSSTATGLKWATATTAAFNYSLINAGGTALTGAATVTVTGISGKQFLMIAVDGASGINASQTIALRLNTDTGNNYAYVMLFTGASSGGTGNLAGDYIPLGDMGNSAANTVSSIITIGGCNATGYKNVNVSAYATGSSTQIHRVGNGYYTGTSTISSISIVAFGGALDAGTVYVYGA